MGKHGHRPLLRFLRSPSRPGPFWRGLLGCQLVVQLIVPASPLHEAHSSPLPAPLNCAAAVAAENQQLGQLLQRASRLDVVLLGEIHTSAADHAWQLRTLEALAQRHKPLALGLEMVPTARQPALSRFSRGELDEAGFLAAVDWPRVWGHDPELYLPILRWARRQGVPLLALNVEAAVVKRVRRDGLAAIPPADREGIGNPRPAGATYRQLLRSAWQAHRAMEAGQGDSLSPAQEEDLERFIASQLLRDRAMAERLAAAHRRQSAQLVVALVGRGHLEGDDGVPAQLRQLGLERVVALQRPEQPEGCGAPPAGVRLGAYLESADGAVWVRRVAPGSAAEAAGLQPGDRVLAINGEPVQRAGQVIRRVGQQPEGVELQLLIERGGRRLPLRLQLPPPTAGSPGRMGAIPPCTGTASHDSQQSGRNQHRLASLDGDASGPGASAGPPQCHPLVHRLEWSREEHPGQCGEFSPV